MMICTGRSGETSSTSIVPVSFSRVMVMEVISVETSMRITAMSPGTKRLTLSSVGLKRIRTTGSMRTPPEVPLDNSRCTSCSTAAVYDRMMRAVFGSVASVMICTAARPSCASCWAKFGSKTMASRMAPRSKASPICDASSSDSVALK
jgi:hypothetical protein